MLLALAGCTGSVKVGPQAVAGLTPDATVQMRQVQVAYLASGGGGTGTLYYAGRAYPFIVAGLGIGGIGASTLTASGDVYKLGAQRNSPAPTGKPATELLSATRAQAISGYRTRRA